MELKLMVHSSISPGQSSGHQGLSGFPWMAIFCVCSTHIVAKRSEQCGWLHRESMASTCAPIPQTLHIGLILWLVPIYILPTVNITIIVTSFSKFCDSLKNTTNLRVISGELQPCTMSEVLERAGNLKDWTFNLKVQVTQVGMKLFQILDT